jgi:dolichol-phosphate mannosyltransferase
MSDNKKALVIFPTYNERDNIERIIPAVLDKDPSVCALVVDDNSPDGTGAIADRMAQADDRVHVLHRDRKDGLGRAYIAGFKWALENEFDYVFEMDADFSHSPDYIPAFLKAIRENDLVIGSRYISGVNVINWPMSRLLLSYFANFYTRVITGLPVRDGTGGFKCFRREVLETIKLDEIKSNGYIFQIEVSMRAWKRGFKIAEIPIVFVDREKGVSKMSKKIVREAIWKVWYLRLMSILGRIR